MGALWSWSRKTFLRETRNWRQNSTGRDKRAKQTNKQTKNVKKKLAQNNHLPTAKLSWQREC